MRKSIIQESYIPKLNLTFEPPIINDSFGVNQVNNILKLIESLYPNTKWWYGGKPSEYNPFLHLVDEENEDSGYPEEICNFIIGHRDDFPNRITYGMYCDEDYGNRIDGYKWLKNNEPDYDETEGMFNQLNEDSIGGKVSYAFEPPIEDVDTLKKVLDLFNIQHPNLKWVNDLSILSHDIYTEVFVDAKSFIGALTIGYFDEAPNQLSWSSWFDPDDKDNGRKVDGWEWIKDMEHNYDETDDIFNQLNESIEFNLENYYQSKTLFYEVGKSGEPIKHDDIVGDDLGDLLHVGKRDGQYLICYYVLIDNQKYEECVGGQKLLLKALMNREIVPVPYDEVGNPFDQLNENIDEDDVPKVTYVFEPPIEDRETLESVLYAVGNEHPNITWPTGAPILSYDVYREIFIDNEGYDFVNGLSIFPNESGPDTITWTSWVDPRGSYSDYGPKADGWQLLEKTTNLDTDDMFNQLNEGRYQPKLNLRFEDGISDADELDKVLQVLSVIYPGLTWLGGAPITNHNVIRDQEHGDEDFYYDPIYYLTIGFFSGKWDKLTYTNGTDGDISYADDEHSNYDWVDGYKWVRDNQINYDETDDMFQQLNETLAEEWMYEYDENNPLHKFDIFLDKTNTASDIKYILDLYKEFGIPSSKKNEWNNSDIDYCHEWFLDPKKDGQGMVIGTGVNASGYYIYWEGVKDDRPKVRSSVGTNKELITFDRFLELTSIDDDNIFG